MAGNWGLYASGKERWWWWWSYLYRERWTGGWMDGDQRKRTREASSILTLFHIQGATSGNGALASCVYPPRRSLSRLVFFELKYEPSIWQSTQCGGLWGWSLVSFTDPVTKTRLANPKAQKTAIDNARTFEERWIGSYVSRKLLLVPRRIGLDRDMCQKKIIQSVLNIYCANANSIV